MKKQIGFLIQITRKEVVEWIEEWYTKWGVRWRECATHVNDNSYGKETDITKLVTQDRDLRLILTSHPISPEVNMDVYFVTRHQDFGYLIFDIGRQTSMGLFESYLTGYMSPDLRKVAEFLKKNTFRGVSPVSVARNIPNHYYTKEAFVLFKQGLAMFDVSGDVLYLGDRTK
ncbi:hypothetical protein SH501x_004746 [Pirellulaceae bacterium SH501]